MSDCQCTKVNQVYWYERGAAVASYTHLISALGLSILYAAGFTNIGGLILSLIYFIIAVICAGIDAATAKRKPEANLFDCGDSILKGPIQ